MNTEKDATPIQKLRTECNKIALPNSIAISTGKKRGGMV